MTDFERESFLMCRARWESFSMLAWNGNKLATNRFFKGKLFRDRAKSSMLNWTGNLTPPLIDCCSILTSKRNCFTEVTWQFIRGMDPLRKRIQHKDTLNWRSPPSPCGPSSPQSPPPLVVRGKSLSLNRVAAPALLEPIRETGAKELSKRGRKQRLLLSQAGNLTLKRRETSPDFNKLEARLKPRRGTFVILNDARLSTEVPTAAFARSISSQMSSTLGRLRCFEQDST